MGARTLYLVRHGQYSLDRSLPGDPDGALTAIGREQAALTAERLRGLPIARIHHSTLRRAGETATIIAAAFPGVPLHAAAVLRECVPDLPPTADLSPAIRDALQAIPARVLAVGPARAARVYVRYLKQTRGADQQEIIVCHGNLIRYLACRALGAPPTRWLTMQQFLGAITQITISRQQGIALVCHNDSGHLPTALRID